RACRSRARWTMRNAWRAARSSGPLAGARRLRLGRPGNRIGIICGNVAEPRHLFVMIGDDPADLIGRQPFPPLAGTAGAEEGLGIDRALAEAVTLLHLLQNLEGGEADRPF